MAQVAFMTSEKKDEEVRTDLPEVQHKSYTSAPKIYSGTKVAINVSIQLGRQAINKALSQAGSLYGNDIFQGNINNAITLAGYGAQIASTGWMGVAMVGAQLGYQAFQNNIKQQQAVNKVNYNNSTVGYISNGNGRYDQ